MADLYETLGVNRDSSFDEIKKSYRKLAREFHPDVNPDPGVKDRFKEITAAYEVLSDPTKRQKYDLGGDPFSQFGGQQNFGFGDIMDAFFDLAGNRILASVTSWMPSSAVVVREVLDHAPGPAKTLSSALNSL